jgi:autonomous glycyl radical cofactor GrcA
MEPFVQPDVLTPLLARTIRRPIRRLRENMVGAGHSPHPILGSERETLENTQKEPEKYPELIVRICGFAAYFI